MCASCIVIWHFFCDQEAEQGKQGGLFQNLASSLLRGVGAAATFEAACLSPCNSGSHASEIAMHSSLLLVIAQAASRLERGTTTCLKCRGTGTVTCTACKVPSLIYLPIGSALQFYVVQFDKLHSPSKLAHYKFSCPGAWHTGEESGADEDYRAGVQQVRYQTGCTPLH